MIDIERPLYFEGQILGAADLQRSLDYARDQHARHLRETHSWGIVSGLSLQKSGQDEISLSPGLAVDSSGAEIVVREAVALEPADFIAQVGGSATQVARKYPVFIARTNSRVESRRLFGSSGANDQSRITEGCAVRYRASAADWDTDQRPPGIAQGPDDSEESSRVVLVGFVHWNRDSGRFDDFSISDGERSPRFVGVRADQVTASHGSLTLRSQSSMTTDAPMLTLNGTTKDQLFVLGVDKGDGAARPLLTVDAEGNVTALGVVRGQVAMGAGQVLVQSGVATDGVTLPLPRGMTDASAKGQGVTIHARVSPRIDWSLQPTLTESWAPFVLECAVDENRRVRCQIRWLRLGGPPLGAYHDVAGAVDYTLLATVPPKASAS